MARSKSCSPRAFAAVAHSAQARHPTNGRSPGPCRRPWRSARHRRDPRRASPVVLRLRRTCPPSPGNAHDPSQHMEPTPGRGRGCLRAPARRPCGGAGGRGRWAACRPRGLRRPRRRGVAASRRGVSWHRPRGRARRERWCHRRLPSGRQAAPRRARLSRTLSSCLAARCWRHPPMVRPTRAPTSSAPLATRSACSVPSTGEIRDAATWSSTSLTRRPRSAGAGAPHVGPLLPHDRGRWASGEPRARWTSVYVPNCGPRPGCWSESPVQRPCYAEAQVPGLLPARCNGTRSTWPGSLI